MNIKAKGAYTELILQNGKRKLLSHNLAYYEKLLPDYFCRVHRAFIVNKNYIESFNPQTREILLTNGEIVMVSVRKLRCLKEESRYFITQKT